MGVFHEHIRTGLRKQLVVENPDNGQATGEGIWVKNDTGADIVAGAVGRLLAASADGFEYAELDTNTGNENDVIVAASDIADTEFGWCFKFGANITVTGLPSATYTAGNGLRVDGSTADVVDSGSAAAISNANDFGETAVTGTTVTAIVINLYDRESTVQT